MAKRTSSKKTPPAAKRKLASRKPKTPSKGRTAPAGQATRAKKAKKARKATRAAAAKKKTAARKPPRKAPTAPDASAKAALPDLRRKRPAYATAESMAKSQRSISVSEFFAKNRHLLGFDNPRKALLTTIKEAVDNALDACEEAGILPEIAIGIEQLGETHFRIWVQDNGPGILKSQIPNIFGKLLYGSKFHRLRMSRGQQGIGISAAGMYGLLTTGKAVDIISRTGKRASAHHYTLQIDTRKNRPVVIRDDVVEWDAPHGTRVAIELEARYQRGRQSVDDYLSQTAIANPHVSLTYHAPDGRVETYPASVTVLPPIAREVRPHPHGVELGVLLKMMQDSKCRRMQKFLTSEFSRVSPRVAKAILETAGVEPKRRPSRLNGDAAKAIYEAIGQTKIMAPATDCVVPIGQEKLIAGLKQVVEANFYTAVTRKPAVYRGNPFIIEAALAYGRAEPKTDQDGAAARPAKKKRDADTEQTQLAKLIRFANRVPLQYQQGGCAITRSVIKLNWKSYGLTQGRGALPSGPLTIVVHMASVWVPFTSESKEAIASYPEIRKEMRLALQECGRKLGLHVRKTVRIRQELKKRSYIEQYIPAIGEALRDILDLGPRQVTRVCADLKDVLERSRKF